MAQGRLWGITANQPDVALEAQRGQKMHMTTEDLRHDRARETGAQLRSLLLERAEYRDRWWRFERREPARGRLNQAAVAQVIAHHLWDSGDRRESDVSLPRELKDRVRRALSGQVISAETLGWFIDAFRMTDGDAERLRSTRFATRPEAAVPIVGTLRRPQFVPLPQRHRTLAVFERRVIDQNGRAAAHRSTRAFAACEDEMDSYPCRLVPNARSVKILQGGREFYVRSFQGSTPILEIKLNSVLRSGEVASLEYEAEFEGGGSADVEYRRVAHGRVENLSIVIQFHPDRPPRHIWRATWDDYRNGNIVDQEPAHLDQSFCAQRFIPYLENAAAGFLWSW